MTDRINEMLAFFIRDKKHHIFRKPAGDPYVLARTFAKENVPDEDRAAARLLYVLEQEKPVIFEGERIALLRTVSAIPELFTEEELTELKKSHWIHERGDISNICVDYTKLLDVGFDARRAELARYKADYLAKGDKRAAHYLDLQISTLDAVAKLTERYRLEALEKDNRVVAQTLSRIPASAPQNLLEALQMFRILHFTLWCAGNYHNTIGRFDQYMYPYLKKDMDLGLYDYDSALELLEEFFITFNRDSDMYPGMQQGDNGQSLMLGGLNEDGSDSYNLLSELCLKASLHVKLIDPKINLRVHKDTPMDVYLLGTELTKQGLGFPQYCNDDVVIPGLLNLGYEKKDVYNYTVAACWEFIIPGLAMDVVNIGALSFAKAVEDVVLEELEQCSTYKEFESRVRLSIKRQTDSQAEQVQNLYLFPAPFLSLMMDGCSEKATDVSRGCKYNNYGFHGSGIATAADSMAAVKKYVFEEKSVDKKTLIKALTSDFEGEDQLAVKLRFDAPKMGNNIDYVDEIAASLLQDFALALKGKKNGRGGIFRAGTGSAMYYLWHAREIPATPDGRRKGEGLAANFSPSLFARCKGPVSIIKSFTKPDLKLTINGGPLTLELQDTVFRSKESMMKVAMLVKSFIDLGGHELQLNSVNRDTLLDAQKHPEYYHNLIVRVWGWSGYFVELDKEYQDHIIHRMELVV